MTKTIFHPGKIVSSEWLNKSQYLGPGNIGVTFKANPIGDWEYPLLDSNSLNVSQLYSFFVSISTPQTISGLKTFTAVPRVPTSLGTNSLDVVNFAALQVTLADYVDLNSSQTINGNKVFTSIQILDPVLNNHPVSKQYFDNNTVQLTGAQSIAGTKTFASIEVPTPTANAHATSKLYVDTVAEAVIPAGVLFPSAGINVPAGFLLCDGSTLNVLSYPDLFAAIAYTYGGSGPGFRLPDLRGKMVLGASGSYVFGTTGGDNDLTIGATTSGATAITANQMPSHSHQIWGTSHTDSDPRNQPHVGADDSYIGLDPNIATEVPEGGGGSQQYFSTNNANVKYIENTGGGQGHTHPISAVNVTNGRLSDYLALNWIIKT